MQDVQNQDIVQRAPEQAEQTLATVKTPGVYWVKWNNGGDWELVVITASGYVQEIAGARRTLPKDRVAGVVVGPVVAMP